MRQTLINWLVVIITGSILIACALFALMVSESRMTGA
jgi:hypothetical protein